MTVSYGPSDKAPHSILSRIHSRPARILRYNQLSLSFRRLARHPVQTQAVTYIVQRFASLATFFYLLSVVSYLKARLEAGEKGTRHRGAALYAIAFFSAVLAMMTKETAFTLPFAIALCEVMFFTGAFRRFYYVLPFLLTLPLIPLNLMASSGYSEDFFAPPPVCPCVRARLGVCLGCFPGRGRAGTPPGRYDIEGGILSDPVEGH